MNTSKPIATISYNVVQTDAKGRRSAPYLEKVLSSLIQSGKLLFWCYIYHFSEDDECKKEHIHLYMEPARKIDTIILANHFQEPDPSDVSAPPLGVMPIRNSNFENWYLYSIHNPYYLSQKGLNKKFFYNFDDVRTSCPDELYRLVHMLDMRNYQNDIMAMIDAQSDGKTFIDYCKSGKIDLRKYIPASKMWKDIAEDSIEKLKKEYERKNETTEKIMKHGEDYQIPPDAFLVKSPKGAYTYSTLDGQIIIPKMCRAYIDPSCGLVYFCHSHTPDVLDKIAKSGCVLDPPFVLSSTNYEEKKEKEEDDWDKLSRVSSC